MEGERMNRSPAILMAGRPLQNLFLSATLKLNSFFRSPYSIS